MKYFFTLSFVLVSFHCVQAQYSNKVVGRANPGHVVNSLLQMNGQHNVVMKGTAVPTQRVIAQSTKDNALVSLSDSVKLGYTGMHNSKYDYNTMIYPYNYPYSTTPMFNYAGVFTTPQVLYDTYVHWTINPFAMPAFGLYEGCNAAYDVNNNLISYKHLFVDSVTNDNVSYANTFTTTNKINSGFWFNLNAGVADSAFKQYFSYNTSGKLLVDSVYELHLGVWRIAARTNYSYDGTGNLTQIDHFANETDTSFLLPLVQQSRYVNTYDASNRLATVLTYMYNGTVLAAYVADTFGYSGTATFHNSWKEHQFDAIHGTWWPQYYMSKHVMASGLPDTIYHKGWDSILHSWVPSAMDVVTYNSNNNPMTMQNYLYNWTSYSSTPDYTTTYYYEIYLDATATPSVPVVSNNINVFPNPATNVLTVSLSGEVVNQRVALSVVNVAGQVISRQSVNGSNEAKLDVSGLSAGTYWVLVQNMDNGSVLGRKQFVKE